MEVLSSLKNPKVMLWRSLKDRKVRNETGCFLVEGRRSVEEALRASFPLKALLVTDPDDPFARNVQDVFQVPDHVMAHICDTKTPQGVAAVMQTRTLPLSGRHLVALDGVQDPGNVGTIIRTADAAGLDGVLLSADCADPYSPKVLRSTMGSIFHIPCHVVPDLETRLRNLLDTGYALFSSQLDGEPFFQAVPTLPNPWVLIVGNEGNGIRPNIRSLSDYHLRLPMRGAAESLNAAIAAGIMMYALMEAESESHELNP